LDSTRFRIVLVNPSHPGNIGAAARAMKTMGLSSLTLVDPQSFPSAEATARASGADDVLYSARVCATLDEALAGCQTSIATSARARELGVTELTPREMAKRAIDDAEHGDVAIVFGREKYGLTNDELDRCQAMVKVPTVPSFSSLNLASTVQIVSYELRLALLGAEAPRSAGAGKTREPERVGVDELEGMFGHFEKTLARVGYFDPDNPGRLMRRLRRLFGRSGIEPSELKILRGMLTAVDRACDGKNSSGQK
jgi:TrmH family RNA methyltransferase